MKEFKSRPHTWASLVGVRAQVEALSTTYFKHGNKAHRRRDIGIFTEACVWIARTHHVDSVCRIGRKHVWSFWRAHRQLDDHLLCDYWRGFCAFYEIMKKPGEPPRPRTAQPLDEILLRETVTRRFPAGLN